MKSNSEFLKYLQVNYPQQRLAAFWDGASYHCCVEVKTYWQTLNQDLAQDMWAITCTCFTPNAPQHNPGEDVWLQAKRFIRQYYHLYQSFAIVKFLFEFLADQLFDFPKLSMYRIFS